MLHSETILMGSFENKKKHVFHFLDPESTSEMDLQKPLADQQLADTGAI